MCRHACAARMTGVPSKHVGPQLVPERAVIAWSAGRIATCGNVPTSVRRTGYCGNTRESWPLFRHQCHCGCLDAVA